MIALVLILAVTTATAAPATNALSQAHDDLWRGVTDGCGQSKACFLYPANCYGTDNCVVAVSVLVTGTAPDTKYTFEAQSIGGVYVSVGLSGDQAMNATSVVECVSDSKSAENELSMYSSYNKGFENEREPSPDANLELLGSSYDATTKVAWCQFTRKEVTSYQGQEFNLDTTKFFMILAAGSQADDISIGYHDVAMRYSADQRYLADIGFFQLPTTPVV